MFWTLLLATAMLLVGIFAQIEIFVALGWLLLGGFVISRLWLWRVNKKLYFVRELPEFAHNGDVLNVQLSVNNQSFLPIPWLTVRDTFPPAFEVEPRPVWLLSVRSREKVALEFQVKCKRRGRFTVGPLETAAGVTLDTSGVPSGAYRPDRYRTRLVIYPMVLPLERLGLPSRVSLGNLRTHQHLLPDPSYVAGVRQYLPGDDPRHIDWRNSARVGGLQVKVFEKTRQIPLAIFLDLHLGDYSYERRLAGEAAVVVAASLANRAQELKQPFGLYSNGFDPGWDNLPPHFEMPGPERAPRSGEGWLTETLETLAGIEMRVETLPMAKLMGKWAGSLPWGATIAVVSPEPSPELVGELTRLRKMGFVPLTIFTNKRNHTADQFKQVQALKTMGIQTYHVNHPVELSLGNK
jgi:Protein of unknown function DUF58